MKLTMLGTGNALVTNCYNTCFVLSDDDRHFLVDGGGGNGILTQLKKAGFDWRDMHEIFVTHKHTDHVMGIIWIIRMITQYMNEGRYEGEAWIYGHEEIIEILRSVSEKLLQKKQLNLIGERLHLVPVSDGETRSVIGHEVTFFDIHSTKAMQYGFCFRLNDGRKLTCCGDEPYNPCESVYAQGCDWLLHEAFCLYAQADTFHPYEKHHSTAKDAAELAEKLGVANLLLYHTEDEHLDTRKTDYTAEAEQYYSGRIFVPDDLESVEL